MMRWPYGWRTLSTVPCSGRYWDARVCARKTFNPRVLVGVSQARPDGAKTVQRRGGEGPLRGRGGGELEVAEIGAADEHRGHGLRAERETEARFHETAGIALFDEGLESFGARHVRRVVRTRGDG